MMYPIEAVVLRKNRISEHRLVFTCFSSEYGKIDVFYTDSKGSPKLDTLSHFTGRIMTKEKNTLSQIYKISSFASSDTYEIYDIAGWSVSILYSLLAYGLPYPKLFQLLTAVLEKNTLTRHDFLLFLIQTCRDFGITQCNIGEYAVRLQDASEHPKIRLEIEAWVNSYKLSC
jgi:recombinational DNA repair protein (RecF pathway)